MVESEIKVYISSLSGNKEVKKRQQRVAMILESKHIGFVVVDITEPTNEKEKDFMQANSTELGVTVSDTSPRHPLPPQVYNGEQYCGDYNSFELANENDELEAFLKLEVPEKKNGVTPSVVVEVPVPAENAETIEEVAVNGKPSEQEEETPAAEPTAEPETTTETNEKDESADKIDDSEKTAVDEE